MEWVRGCEQPREANKQDIRIAVGWQGSCRHVTGALITPQCVKQQLVFDPFVMISMQRVRTGFCRTHRYCLSKYKWMNTWNTLQRAVSATCYHVRVCLTASTWAAPCFSKVPYLCVCVSQTGDGGVWGWPFHIYERQSGRSYQLCSALRHCDVTTTPQLSDRQHWAGVHLILDDPRPAGGGVNYEHGEGDRGGGRGGKLGRYEDREDEGYSMWRGSGRGRRREYKQRMRKEDGG